MTDEVSRKREQKKKLDAWLKEQNDKLTEDIKKKIDLEKGLKEVKKRARNGPEENK